MKLSIQVITYNGAKYIAPLFDSLKQQTFKDLELLILDNGSTDNTVRAIQEETGSASFRVTLEQSQENYGFAKGNNILFKKNKSPYILVLNQDAYLAPDCLEKMVKFMDAHDRVAALSPRVMKWNFADGQYTDIVDSLGMEILRNRRVIDRFEGESWSSLNNLLALEYDTVFGVSAGCAMYKRSALEAILYKDGGFFDSAYFMYKEDVDLAYRLRAAGYVSAVLYSALAFHARSTGRSKNLGDLASVENKSKQNSLVRYLSYKNHIINLLKHESWKTMRLDIFAVLWYEAKKFMYFLLFDRKVLKAWREIFKYERH